MITGKIHNQDLAALIFVAMLLTWCTADDAINAYEKTHSCPPVKAEKQ